ncbi:hypothetical protein SCLCIDRAFT_1225034 [Scleroderma citrinum Foug A]|uniref:Uncharacterized protein n=1 Tax=Scleroderma citrinum Foug A TaxID=1036808 RepID=A0A0C3CQL6_9AGAM|nr:hypothetical protein SCLCIDRAFT_1225034 [Scleroderma citrinum Foug A]
MLALPQVCLPGMYFSSPSAATLSVPGIPDLLCHCPTMQCISHHFKAHNCTLGPVQANVTINSGEKRRHTRQGHSARAP